MCDNPFGVINCKCSKGAIMVNCVIDTLAPSDLLCVVYKITQRSCYGLLIKSILKEPWENSLDLLL